jgi:hypothetical protein
MRSVLPAVFGSACWSVCIGRGEFVVAFPAELVGAGLGAQLQAAGIVGAVRHCPAWREFPACVVVRFVPPGGWLRGLCRIRTGGGGSQHPVNGLVW